MTVVIKIHFNTFFAAKIQTCHRMYQLVVVSVL